MSLPEALLMGGAILGAVALLVTAFLRRSLTGLVLVAPLWTWLLTYLLWRPFTGNYNNDSGFWFMDPWAHAPWLFDWWFWILLLLGVVVLAPGRKRGEEHSGGARVFGLLIGVVLIMSSFSAVDYSDLVSDTPDGKSVASAASLYGPVTATPTPSATPVDLGLTPDGVRQIGKGLNQLLSDEFKPGEIAMGTGRIPNSPEERGTAAFTQETIRTQADLTEFLNSNSPLAKQSQARVVQGLHKAGYGEAEFQRALSSGKHWFWLAPTVASQVQGTTYPVNDGTVSKAMGWRQAAPNDAYWFYVTSDEHIVKEASIRADCGNAELNQLRPVRPNTPPAPPITCAVKCKTPPPTGGCDNPKDCKDKPKPVTPRECMQNGDNCPAGHPGNDVRQDPQDNSTSGVNTGHTSGAPTQAPPPADRGSGNENGGSGSGGAPAPDPTVPPDNNDGDQTTGPSSQPCPWEDNC